MFHKEIRILENEEIAPNYFLMYLESPELAVNSSPGQFLHIKCSSGYNPLLRRPLSIHRVIYQEGKAVGVALLYKVVGKGTSYLSQRKKGEIIDCIGPLGRGFEITNVENSIIVAGGIGIAPLFFLAEKIVKSEIPRRQMTGEQNPKSGITIFIGAKNSQELLCKKEVVKLGLRIETATEDGSSGYKGLVSTLFKNQLSTINYKFSTIIYACGPQKMLKEIALFSNKHQIPCQMSFEQFMGCGIGICNACVIATKQGYRKVCKDGPVFWANQIDWERI